MAMQAAAEARAVMQEAACQANTSVEHPLSVR